MGDVPVGAVPAPEKAPIVAPTVSKVEAARAARAAKLADVTKGLASIPADGAVPAGTEKPKDELTERKPVEPAAPAASDRKTDEKPVELKPAAPAAPAEKKPDEIDTQTQKGLALIDKRAAEFRDEQKKAKADLDLERAELARQRAEVTSKVSSFEDLQKLARKDPIAALAKLGFQSEDDFALIGRAAYTQTKEGKADPKAASAVAQTARERELMDQLAELRKGFDDLRSEFQTRDQRAASQQFVERYLDEAVKAIPAERKTLIGNLHTKSPAKARQALHALGAEMERSAMEADGATKYDPSYTPSHAAVVAEYEKRRRAELEEQGVDVDALLAVKAVEQKPTTKTLDPTAPGGIQPINPKPTREEKLKAATRGLAALD